MILNIFDRFACASHRTNIHVCNGVCSHRTNTDVEIDIFIGFHGFPTEEYYAFEYFPAFCNKHSRIFLDFARELLKLRRSWKLRRCEQISLTLRRLTAGCEGNVQLVILTKKSQTEENMDKHGYKTVHVPVRILQLLPPDADWPPVADGF